MKRHPTFIILLYILLAVPQITKAQIGYQVSLLNTATGEPQANKTVNVNIAITNAENEVVHTETQTATTNDFGILSLSVGNEDTFKNADWNKLPFYISVSANGTLIGKSQILTVPVAEYAKTAGPVLTKEMLVGTWSNSYAYTNGEYTYEAHNSITFNENETGNYLMSIEGGKPIPITWKFKDSQVYIYITMEYNFSSYGNLVYSTEPLALYAIFIYEPEENKLIAISGSPSSSIYSKE